MQNSSSLQGFTAFSDAVRFVVGFVMALFAERNAVRNIEAQIRIISEWLNVVCVQVAATIVAAVLTSKSIAGEYIKTPALIFSREPQAAPFNRFAVFVTVASWAARRFLAVVSADLQSGFDRVSFAQSGALALPGLAHLTLGFLGMLVALKGRYATLRAFSFFNTNARLTARRQSIASIAIDVKHGARLPYLAPMAPFQTSLDFRHVLIQSQAQSAGGNLQYT